MLGLDAIDTGVGVCLFFLLASLFCSALREAGETLLKSRARDLERGLRMLLDDDSGVALMPEILGHGLLRSLYDADYDPKRLTRSWLGGGLHLPIGAARAAFPSYIPARQFASALLDVTARGPSDQVYPTSSRQLSAASLRSSLAFLPSARLQRVILSALDTAQGDLDRTRGEIEKWFDGSMDRVSGWYKRRTQIVLFCIGLALAALFNLDALTVTERLWASPALRVAAVTKAESLNGIAGPPQQSATDAGAALAELSYPIGWRSGKNGWPVPAPQACPDMSAACNPSALGFGASVEIGLGWLITAFAVTLGAPFWFDLLNRFMVIRSTIKPTQKSPDEASADPQRGSSRSEAAQANDLSGYAAIPLPTPASPDRIALPAPNWTEGDDLPQWRPGFVNETEVAL